VILKADIPDYINAEEIPDHVNAEIPDYVNAETPDYINASFANVGVLAIACSSCQPNMQERKRITYNSMLQYLHYLCIQGYKQYERFIIAQAPLKYTRQDFWKMIFERECGLIVMLSELVENGEVNKCNFM